MAGLGDGAKGGRRRKRSSLLEQAAAEQRQRQELPPEVVEEPVTESPPTGLTAGIGLSKSKAQERVKATWYVSTALADRVRDTVKGLKKKGVTVNGRKVSAGSLVEPVIHQLLDELEREHNGGKPWPRSSKRKRE